MVARRFLDSRTALSRLRKTEAATARSAPNEKTYAPRASEEEVIRRTNQITGQRLQLHTPVRLGCGISLQEGTNDAAPVRSPSTSEEEVSHQQIPVNLRSCPERRRRCLACWTSHAEQHFSDDVTSGTRTESSIPSALQGSCSSAGCVSSSSTQSLGSTSPIPTQQRGVVPWVWACEDCGDGTLYPCPAHASICQACKIFQQRYLGTLPVPPVRLGCMFLSSRAIATSSVASDNAIYWCARQDTTNTAAPS